MAANQRDRETEIPPKNMTRSSEPAGQLNGSTRPAETTGAGGVWADEKATARAKHDRAATPSKNAPLGDALAVGGGQQSTPYLETQADAIAKQTKRGDV